MKRQRDRDRYGVDATVVLGREIVSEALADPERAARLLVLHRAAVLEAARGILARATYVSLARGFAEDLPHEVRVALAGVWAADAGERGLGQLGIVEVPDDA